MDYQDAAGFFVIGIMAFIALIVMLVGAYKKPKQRKVKPDKKFLGEVPYNKCIVCGNIIEYSRDDIYCVKGAVSLASPYTTPCGEKITKRIKEDALFDAVDCRVCHTQKVLNIRMKEYKDASNRYRIN